MTKQIIPVPMDSAKETGMMTDGAETPASPDTIACVNLERPEPHELGHEIIATDHNQIDEISPYYLHNIRYFHHLGGFQAILHRIQREPRVSFNGVRLLLRPFLKVRLSPHFCVPAAAPRAPLPAPCVLLPACS